MIKVPNSIDSTCTRCMKSSIFQSSLSFGLLPSVQNRKYFHAEMKKTRAPSRINSWPRSGSGCNIGGFVLIRNVHNLPAKDNTGLRHAHDGLDVLR